MRTPDADFITDLNARAVAAQRDEIDFRDSVAAEIARRERARQFAFRRLDLAKTMAAAAKGAETREDAVARQLAALKRELDWHSDSEARTRILDAWRPVAETVWHSLAPTEVDTKPAHAATTHAAHKGTPAKDAVAKDAVAKAFAAFEGWYEAEHGNPFLALLDVEIQEMPVVEF